jgi:hypothetical protein
MNMTKEKMANDEYILQELKKGRTISRRIIYTEIGYFKTPTAISTLRNLGHNIIGKSVRFTNQLGNKGRYHEYYLVQPEQRELF